MQTQKKILIIAGPNGAGKTRFATEFLPNEADCPTYINADLIAAGLSPFRPHVAALGAGRLMLKMMHDYVRRGESFAFETTLSGRSYAGSIPLWKEKGYRISLVFLWLPTPEVAIARVRQRVLEGGHDVPELDVRRRFARSLAHLPAAIARSDEARLYDNTDPDRPHREIALIMGANRWAAERLPGWAAAALDSNSGS